MHRLTFAAPLVVLFACTSSSSGTGTDDSTGTSATSDAATSAATTMPAGTETSVDPDTTAGASTSAPTTGPADPCGGDGSICVPSAGPDWLGPLMLRETGGEMAPGCESPFAGVDSTIYADLTAPPATCGCTCEAAGDPSCPPIEVGRWLSNNCGGMPSTTWDLTSSCDAGVNLSSGQSVRADPIMVEGGSCVAAPTVDVQPAAFLRQFLLCSPDTELAACDGGTCAPALPADDTQLCVVREGDFPCPAEWAADRSLRYRTFADDRGCTECVCAPFSAECEGYSVVLFPTNDCSGLPSDSIATSGNCREISTGISSARVSAGVPPDVDCTGHQSGGESAGSAGPLMPVTVCCAR